MTTVAWDGRILAADRQLTESTGTCNSVTKIWRLKDGALLGIAGNWDYAMNMKNWFEKGGNPDDFPTNQKVEGTFVACLYITPAGVMAYDRSPYPMHIESPFTAIGSGAQFAMGAMHMGASAVEAVDVACFYDSHSGNGHNYLYLTPP